MVKSRRRARKKEKPAAAQMPAVARASRAAGRVLWFAVAAVVVAVMVAGAVLWLGQGAPPAPERRDAQAPAQFVGSETCSGCHEAEAGLWRKSQHSHAMAHASEATVRGDFNEASFDDNGIRSRFFRKDGRYMVETDGVDGRLAIFEIEYTFGVDPLQQYLIGFPDGRIQALSIAWDTRPKEQGGQRWFHLYPGENISHDDPLHWTRANQNWNFMCAECHSTGVHKNYDAGHDRFATTFAEISVGCEACHGAGARHVAWARGGKPPGEASKGLAVIFGERTAVSWQPDPASGLPVRSTPPAGLRKEVETCGLCHARRSQQSEDWTPGQWLSDTHRVSPLDRRHFHADGQMRDVEETYNYAPFKQSRMFAAGVTCSDCHDPHAASLRAPGDAACAQCHLPTKYESVAHHHHQQDASPGCAACHMPLRDYMVIDRRHDHSFRIPRPDLSVKIGAPNACTDCHRDKPAPWAAAAVENWFGPRRHGWQTYGEAFHAAWSEAPDAAALLEAVAASPRTPALVRASALSELGAAGTGLAGAALEDPDPMVRLGGLDVLEALPDEARWPLAGPRLSDPVRGVRIRAAELLASVPIERRPVADRDKFEKAAAEFVAAQKLNFDRPEARTTLGAFLARQGRWAQAEEQYRAALGLDDRFTPAAIDLADLFRQAGRDREGVGVLRAALVASQSDASLHHALGLALIRLKQRDAALGELRRAAELDPQAARYVYVYAVALQSAGRLPEASVAVKTGLKLHPNDRDLLSAAISFSRQAGDIAGALVYAERLARLTPDDQNLARTVEALRRDAGAALPR